LSIEGRRAAGIRTRVSLPPAALVATAIISVQIGAATARTLFADAGPAGVVFLRLLFGATALALLGRPELRSRSRRELLLLAAFAATLASMNLSFYGAIDRIPLGIAVTLEFVGPLAVAIAGSRRLLDVVWVVAAGVGVVLLAGGAGVVRPLGVGLALTAGGLWATYILLGARLGRVYPGASGLAGAMLLAACLVSPLGIVTAGHRLFSAHVIVLGAAIGVLSSAIPWSLELEALRRMPTQLFGVLMSLEPAAAAVAGFAVLGQHLRGVDVVAIALVIVASAGASWSSRAPAPHEP
jgi:inner membrane transporter RhtA